MTLVIKEGIIMNDKLRIGVIGYGLRGDFVTGFHQPDQGSVVTALAELDQNRIDQFKRDINEEVFITNDYHDLLNKDDIDAILLLTEDYKHKDMALEILAAHKHVYLEKPMAITIEDCDEMMAACEQSGCKMMMGFNMRYMPMFRTMKYYIDQGFIGEITSVWLRHFSGSGGRYYFQDWHRNREYTNSLLLQKASHDFDMIHMLTGSYTNKVIAFGSLDFYNNEELFMLDGLTHQTDAEINVEDNIVMIMELENGIKCSYMQCHFTPETLRNYTLIGTKGRMELDYYNQQITINTRHTSTLLDQSDIVIDMKKQSEGHAGGDKHIAEAFINYILNDIEPNATLLDGRMSVATGVKGTESLREGGVLKYIPSYPIW